MTSKFFIPFCISSILLLIAACQAELPTEVEQAMANLPAKVDFNEHIRPILSDRCWSCHGPDEAARKANLRLDIEEEAFKALSNGRRAFVSGSLRKSEAFQRMISIDPELQMPPPESHLSLSAKEIALIAEWIDHGAEWKGHWSFLPIEAPTPPKVTAESITHNPIDQFILAKLEEQQLQPSPQAEPAILIRRLYLDLTGLIPTPEQVERFVQNPSDEHYAQIVDSLLSSTAHAERLAMEWLDVARYADSHGMHADGWRSNWPWRDWVIRAFEQNMPYDQFVKKQLAGDLLPDAQADDVLATAFQRNHPMTAEGGVIDEEFRLSYVFDRLATASTAFLGLTMDCARCHDHKFDPISQKEYYSMAAFFNNIKELGMTGDDGNFGPIAYVMTDSLQQVINQCQEKLQAIETQRASNRDSLLQIASFIKQISNEVTPKAAIHVDFEKPKSKDYGYLINESPKSKATASKGVTFVEGRNGQAVLFDNQYDDVYTDKVGFKELYEPFSAAAWINTAQRRADKMQQICGTTGDKNNAWRGWEFYLTNENRLAVRLISVLPHNYRHFETRDSIAINQWTHVAFSYDGTNADQSISIYIDGQRVEMVVKYNQLTESILSCTANVYEPENRSIRWGAAYRSFTGEYGLFVGMMDDLYFFEKTISPLEVAQLAELPETAITEEMRKDHAWLQSPTYSADVKQRQALQKQSLTAYNQLTEVMVMQEMDQPRAMHVLNRGAYDQPRQRVEPNTPTAVLTYPDDLPKNRLGLTEWLFSPEHPLTARVTANRYWQMIFGEGLVRTPHDFGSQGELPSHPELLDWLALELQSSEWNLRTFLRTLVLSATYRQSSMASPELSEQDPTNKWLARAHPQRLTAEMIRDNALASSGMLSKKVGGPSVKPYQPEGLWIELGNFSAKLLHFEQDQGEASRRRSMYTFIRRTSPPPFMTNFDAPNRDICTVKREQTNTPLQALNLLNDPQFVEAARVMAQRVQSEWPEHTPEQQITQMYRLVVGQKPNAAQYKILVEHYAEQLQHFQNTPTAIDELLSVGQYPIPKDLKTAQTAALAIVSSTLFNSDLFYTKR